MATDHPSAVDRPVGPDVDWRPAERPARSGLRGAHVLIRPLDPDHDAQSLYAESHPPFGYPGLWTYLPHGPYRDPADLRDALRIAAASEDPLFFTLVPLPAERPAGVASYLRITPEHGVIEIGHIWLSPQLQRTRQATEAIFLMARHAFDVLGNRRLEWKCDAANAPSRRAAERFGFVFEGVFRQHRVIKGRNRDTAWYSITDGEWPVRRAAFEAWLSPENFESSGRQRRSLAELREGIQTPAE
jgi:RimJ/RimL family protein N-acetyltransferase